MAILQNTPLDRAREYDLQNLNSGICQINSKVSADSEGKAACDDKLLRSATTENVAVAARQFCRRRATKSPPVVTARRIYGLYRWR